MSAHPHTAGGAQLPARPGYATRALCRLHPQPVGAARPMPAERGSPPNRWSP